ASDCQVAACDSLVADGVAVVSSAGGGIRFAGSGSPSGGRQVCSGLVCALAVPARQSAVRMTATAPLHLAVFMLLFSPCCNARRTHEAPGSPGEMPMWTGGPHRRPCRATHSHGAGRLPE